MSRTPLLRHGLADSTQQGTSGTFDVVTALADNEQHDSLHDLNINTKHHSRSDTTRSIMSRISERSLRASRSKADSLASPAEDLPPIGLESLSARSTAISDRADGDDDEPTRRPSPAGSTDENPSDNSM